MNPRARYEFGRERYKVPQFFDGLTTKQRQKKEFRSFLRSLK